MTYYDRNCDMWPTPLQEAVGGGALRKGLLSPQVSPMPTFSRKVTETFGIFSPNLMGESQSKCFLVLVAQDPDLVTRWGNFSLCPSNLDLCTHPEEARGPQFPREFEHKEKTHPISEREADIPAPAGPPIRGRLLRGGHLREEEPMPFL